MSKKILIVEDDKPLLDVLVDKFNQEGFKIIQSKNGEDGLKDALENKPDLILLDIILPKLDGLSMLSKLKEDEHGKNIPVIMLTNLSSSEDVLKAMRSGAHEYLVKADWKLDEIVEKVRKRLGME